MIAIVFWLTVLCFIGCIGLYLLNSIDHSLRSLNLETFTSEILRLTNHLESMQRTENRS